MDRQHRASTSPADVPFSAAVRKLIADANEESARFRHQYIGTEHLVLALSRQSGDAAPLPALALDPERVHTLVSDIIRRGSAAPQPNLERPFTSRTQTALSLAGENARELGHSQIGVGDLVVGLMRERMNIAAQVLTDEGLTLERANDYARHNSI